MSLMDTPVRPVKRKAPKPATSRWEVGDIVSFPSTGMRFKIRMILEDGTVELESMNAVNADSWWATTLDVLPPKPAVKR